MPVPMLECAGMRRVLIVGGLAVVALAACGAQPGGVADNSHASGGAAGSTSGSGGMGGVKSDAAAGSGGLSGTGGTAGQDSGVSFDLCADPAGNLFAHGTFEEGMSGQAPTNWEVRNPAQPGNCSGSGTASEHVFLAPPPTGCSGNALAIDARGQWDCFAVQRVSDYNSIEGGATYRISADVRAQGNAVNPAAWFVLGVQWLDANDAFFGDVKNPKPAAAADNDYDWKVLSWDIVAPANARRILVWLSAHYPGRVDYDNISVVKL